VNSLPDPGGPPREFPHRLGQCPYDDVAEGVTYLLCYDATNRLVSKEQLLVHKLRTFILKHRGLPESSETFLKIFL